MAEPRIARCASTMESRVGISVIWISDIRRSWEIVKASPRERDLLNLDLSPVRPLISIGYSSTYHLGELAGQPNKKNGSATVDISILIPS